MQRWSISLGRFCICRDGICKVCRWIWHDCTVSTMQADFSEFEPYIYMWQCCFSTLVLDHQQWVVFYSSFPSTYISMMFEAFGFTQERTLHCRNLSQLPSVWTTSVVLIRSSDSQLFNRFNWRTRLILGSTGLDVGWVVQSGGAIYDPRQLIDRWLVTLKHELVTKKAVRQCNSNAYLRFPSSPNKF